MIYCVLGFIKCYLQYVTVAHLSMLSDYQLLLHSVVLNTPFNSFFFKCQLLKGGYCAVAKCYTYVHTPWYFTVSLVS